MINADYAGGMNMLCCPVCSEPLIVENKRAACKNGHCFDVAKEGYLNLLLSNRSGDKIGDDKFSARCRRDFLNKGYYKPLRDYLLELFREKQGTLLDICCGEGYYGSALAELENIQVYGFDISKEMVRLAAKRGKGTFFVANFASIPVRNESFDYAIHLFAPFQEKNFARVLKSGGRLYTVVPGSHHLFGLKQALYDVPYVNDEQLPATENLKLISREKITADICLENPEDIDAVFRMTPYYFHTSQSDKDKLKAFSKLDTPIEFVIGCYEK